MMVEMMSAAAGGDDYQKRCSAGDVISGDAVE